MLFTKKKKPSLALFEQKFSLKKSKNFRCSFFFLYLFKKKISNHSSTFDFFFFNDLYYLFFRKIFAIFTVFNSELAFIADKESNLGVNLVDLNFFLSKKNYLFIKLLECSPNDAALSFFSNHFKFFFLADLSTRFLSERLTSLNMSCGLSSLRVKPNFYSFFLPIILDRKFSLFFYKFFFFYLMQTY